MKWYWKIVGVVAILVFGWVVYEAISSRLLVRRTNDTIAELRADNQRLADRLGDAEERVGVLQGTVADSQRANAELGERLAESEASAAGLRADNQRLRAELGRSRADTVSLRAENQRLGELLESSADTTADLGDTHSRIGSSIDRAIDIVDRITGSAEGE